MKNIKYNFLFVINYEQDLFSVSAPTHPQEGASLLTCHDESVSFSDLE